MVDKVRDMKRRVKDDELPSSDEVPLSDIVCSTKESTKKQSAQYESENEDFMIDDDDSDADPTFDIHSIEKV